MDISALSRVVIYIFMERVVREAYSRVNGMGLKMSFDGKEEWVLSQLFLQTKPL